MSTEYIYFTAGQKEAARQTDLVSLLQSQGEHLKRSGKEYVWRDGSERLRSEEICGSTNTNASAATPLTSSADFITWTFRRPSISCSAITVAHFRKPSRSSESRRSRSPFRRKTIICGECMPICLTAEG